MLRHPGPFAVAARCHDRHLLNRGGFMGASARPVRICAVIGAAALALSGCSASPPVGDASPTPTPEATTAIVLTRDGAPMEGAGPEFLPGVPLAVPEGDFRSLTIDFECTGDGRYSIGLGSEISPNRTIRSGECEGASSLLFSFHWRSDDLLTVIVDGGTAWKATPHFSTAAFVDDESITEDCAAFSVIFSAIFNADTGYAEYDDIDEAEWNERIDTASDDLAELADSAQSSLAATFADLVPALRSPDRVVGDLRSSIGPTERMIGDACNANESPLQVDAAYGG